VRSYLLPGFAGALSISLAGCSDKNPDNRNNPNIIFILADDIGEKRHSVQSILRRFAC
jgi:hypothetical protein